MIAAWAWSAVVVNWNGAADLPTCLAALAAQTWPPARIVVVDNDSADDSCAVLAALLDVYPTLRLVPNTVNAGFAGGANDGITTTTTALVATLNPDVRPEPSWAERLRVAFEADERLAAASGKFLYPDRRTIQFAGGSVEPVTLVTQHIGRGEVDDGRYDAPMVPDFLTGGALMLRRAAWEAVGGFDRHFHPVYYEDVDLCYRLVAAGWHLRYQPDAVVVHRESASLDQRGETYHRLIAVARLRFAAKHLSSSELLERFVPAEATRLGIALANDQESARAERAALAAFGRAFSASAPAKASAPLPVVEAEAALAEAATAWLVRPRPLTSSLPLIGSAVAWCRERVLDVATRWHVAALVAQQVEFNAAIYRAARQATATATAARLEHHAATALLHARLAAVEAEVAALRQRLAALEPGANGQSQASDPPLPPEAD